MRGATGRERIEERRGDSAVAALFFVALMLPLFFLFFSLFLDVGSYYREQQRAQVAIDEAVMQGIRYLPDQRRAERATRLSLERYGELLQGALIEVQSDAVIVTLERVTPLTFAQFFVEGVGVPFTAQATARVDPVDAYVGLDVSRRVAPDSVAATEEFMQAAPAATFFEYDFPITVNGSTLDPRFATALCFNPHFSAVKRTAVTLVEYLEGFRLNAVGAGVFPSVHGLEDVTPLTLGIDRRGGGAAIVRFPSYRRLEGQASWCAAAAHRERVELGRYGFPGPLPGVEPISPAPPFGEEIVQQGSFDFNPGYAPYLRTAEALWAQVAHVDTPQTGLVLREMASKLVTLPRAERGGLRNGGRSVGIVVAGDLPWGFVEQVSGGGDRRFVPFRFGSHPAVEADLRDSLGAYRGIARDTPSKNVQLFFVLVVHDSYRSAIDQQRRGLEQLFDEANQDPLSAERLGNFSARLIIVESPEQALRMVSTAVALAGRQGALSR